VQIDSLGSAGSIGVGWAPSTFPDNFMVGWKEGSYGYHGDDGMKFGGAGHGTAFGPTWAAGDVIGVGYDRSRREIFFVRNGVLIGVAFTSVPDLNYIPTVTFHSSNEGITMNLGGTPFLTTQRYGFNPVGFAALLQSTSPSNRTPRQLKQQQQQGSDEKTPKQFMRKQSVDHLNIDSPSNLSAERKCELWQCSICLDPFEPNIEERVPRLLSCGHSFCTTCLTRLAAKKDEVTCPLDRTPTPIPSSDL
jgi:hypothetical protein